MTSEKLLLPNPLESLFVTSTTMCNLRCVFCAYAKSSIQNQVMPLDDFKENIEKAIHFGFDTFNLTPMLGEPMKDPLFIERLTFLDRHQGVHDYYFSTNLTLANDQIFAVISDLKKLRWLSISVYGHDRQSFQDITRTSGRLYSRLLRNLHLLSKHRALFPVTEIKMRSRESFDLNTHQSELCAVITQLRDNGVRIRVPKAFSNWAGLVDTAELEKRSMRPKIISGPKTAPCVFLFYKPVILPSSQLNACSAGDGNANFIIGSLKENDFAEILSSSNPAYMHLLQSHIRGDFNDICMQCTAYRSIHEFAHSYRYHRKPRVSLAQFLQRLNA
jgi:sulfatase maturation enzyme AslB (radical SAM superfamily)